MKHPAAQIGLITIGALVCVVVAGARESAREATAQGNQAGSVVTVSGCLIQMSSEGSTVGGSAPDGTSPRTEPINQPSTASPSDQERFVLANARPAKEEERQKPETPSAAGVSGTAGSGATPQSVTGGATPPPANAASSSADGGVSVRYLVTGLSREELRKHINHQVELSGRVEEPRLSDSPGPTTGSTARNAADRISALPRLDAKSLKMIAGVCSSPGSRD